MERVVPPDACLVLDFALARMSGLIANLEVDIRRMQSNLDATQGLVFSQAVLLALIESGMKRDEAYRIVQRKAMLAWDDGHQLKGLLEKDPEVDLGAATLEDCFTPTRFLRNSEVVFSRLESKRL